MELAEDAAAAHERLVAKLGKPSEAREAGEGEGGEEVEAAYGRNAATMHRTQERVHRRMISPHTSIGLSTGRGGCFVHGFKCSHQLRLMLVL